MKKGKQEEVWVWFVFSFWLVTVDLRDDKKNHIGLWQSLRAPGVLSLTWSLVDDCRENTRKSTIQMLFPLVRDAISLPDSDIVAASSGLRALHRPFFHVF